MKKQAVVNQIKRESEVLEDRLLDKVLAQVPSIVRRELTKLLSSEETIDRAAKDRRDMQRQIDTFNAFYKTEIRRIDEYLKTRMDQLAKDHAAGLKNILDAERSKVIQDAIETAKLDVNNQMRMHKKELLQIQHSWMPSEIQRCVGEAIEVHEKHCLVDKCSIDKSEKATSTIPEAPDLGRLILAALSHTPPNGPRLSAADKEIYTPHYIAKRANVRDSNAYRILKELSEAGKVKKGEFLYGTQYGTAYWIDDAAENDDVNSAVLAKIPLTAIKPAAVLDILAKAKEIDPQLPAIPRDDIHTIYGIVKQLGFADDRERDAIKKVRTILYGLVRDELVLKKTIALTYPSGENRADWAFWRSEKTRASA
jgi:hypothetical protein